jgi:FixJ family two-component response regulator
MTSPAPLAAALLFSQGLAVQAFESGEAFLERSTCASRAA